MATDPVNQSAGPDEGDLGDLRRQMVSGLALAPAGANVIMQLARLPIGRAVVESTVESGALTKHPIKRTRTTLGYVMIALFGTGVERSVLRQEVNAQHRHVHSGDASPVAYDAFDPELQLWVAACMYQGSLDALNFLRGPCTDETRDTLLRHCGRFATTLQVPQAQWPATQTDFDRYWSDSLQAIHVDADTRRYLLGIASLEFLPSPLRRTLGPLHRFVTVGFLPESFRHELGVSWHPRQQRRFARCLSVVAAVNRRLPRALREFPLNLAEWDARRRIRAGRPLL